MFSPADFSDLWKLPICTDSALCDILTKKGNEQKPMHEYEVLIETINPCGGEAHSKKEFLDIEAESPEAYVRAEGRWPVLDTGKNMDGDVVITTGDGKGNMIRYTFTE